MTRDGIENRLQETVTNLAKKNPFPEREGVFSGLFEPLSGDPHIADGSCAPGQLNVTRTPASTPSVSSAALSLSMIR